MSATYSQVVEKSNVCACVFPNRSAGSGSEDEGPQGRGLSGSLVDLGGAASRD